MDSLTAPILSPKYFDKVGNNISAYSSFSTLFSIFNKILIFNLQFLAAKKVYRIYTCITDIEGSLGNIFVLNYVSEFYRSFPKA